MPYFEFVQGNASKFWEIHDYLNADKPYVYVSWGRIGSLGTEKEFPYSDNNWGSVFVKKKIQEKLDKGYVKAKKSKIASKKVTKPPVIKKTVTKPSVIKTKGECPPGKVVNPKTGRCIKEKSKTKTKSKSIVKKPTIPIYKNGDRWKPYPFSKTDSCRIKTYPSKRDNRGSNNLNQTIPPYDPSYCVNRKVKASNGDTYETVDSKKTFTDMFGTSYVQKWVKIKEKSKSKPKPNPKPSVVKTKKSSTTTKPKPSVVKSVKKGKVLWDVKKQGVMLAHTFKDPSSGKIRTAPKGCDQAPKGWFLSEKYDGYRAIWDGKDFRSRAGNIFNAPNWFKAWLPINHSLDGELFMGRECFEKCGIFRRKVPDDEEWRKANVTYQIFDSPTISGPFEKRMSEIKKIIAKQCKTQSGKCPLKMTNQTKVKDEVDVSKHFDKLVKQGAEGVMLRAPGSPYDAKRSSYLLKVKQLFDDECKIIGYKSGTGKYASMLGAFECQMVKNPKIKFTISGMDDKIRSNYKKTHPIGTIVTFTYMGLSAKGVPRHPNYLRIRK